MRRIVVLTTLLALSASTGKLPPRVTFKVLDSDE